MKSLFVLMGVVTALSGCATSQYRDREAEEEERRDARDAWNDYREDERESARREKEMGADRRQDEVYAQQESAAAAADRAQDSSTHRAESKEADARYRAYEAEYARQLGKKPSELTPAERAWIREKFN